VEMTDTLTQGVALPAREFRDVQILGKMAIKTSGWMYIFY